jgi:hypothetical protein
VTVIGDRVEIDAKLLSVKDARIITATQQNGSITAIRQDGDSGLRNIVERLGYSLEQQFLSYRHGKLKVTVADPENVNIYLTPVLKENPWPEEIPPVELSMTVEVVEQKAIEIPWVTSPSSKVIDNLLSGWYVIRIVRGGYEDLVADSRNWRAKKDSRGVYSEVFDIHSGKIVENPMLVEVSAQNINEWVIDDYKLDLEKRGGKLRFEIIHNHTDTRHKAIQGFPTAQASLFSKNLEINNYPVGSNFTQNDEWPPTREESGFMFDDFKGGNLSITKYNGEMIPCGTYIVAIYEPGYKLECFTAQVDTGDEPVLIRKQLARRKGYIEFDLAVTSDNTRVFIEGKETGDKLEFDLGSISFKKGSANIREIEVLRDVYEVKTNTPGYSGWSKEVTLEIGHHEANELIESVVSEMILNDQPKRSVAIGMAPRVRVKLKTKLWLAGRSQHFGNSNALYVDEKGLATKLERFFELRKELDDRRRSPDPFEEIAELEQKLEYHLEAISRYLESRDLVILEDGDLASILRHKKLSQVFRNYISEGYAMIAFVSAPGDYRDVFGISLTVESKTKTTKKYGLHLRRGCGINLSFERKLESAREFPLLKSEKKSIPGWDIVAFARNNKQPRIVESGSTIGGGYVIVWCDVAKDLDRFWLAKAARKEVEARAIEWAKYLMYKRLDPDGPDAMKAAQDLKKFGISG